LEVIGSSEAPDVSDGEPWYCGQCREEVDAEFEVCWSCGQPRAEVQQPFPERSSDTSLSSASASSGQDPGEETEVVDARAMLRNPYASPTAESEAVPAEAEPDQFEPSEEAEAILVRAWRASILGFFLLPVILHFYSMYLLIRASMITERFSAKGSRRYYQAWAINVVSGFVWAAVIAFILG